MEPIGPGSSLTTATITVLIYVAYVLFRNGIDDHMFTPRFASIYAIFAFLSVPLTYYSAPHLAFDPPDCDQRENAEGQGSFSIAPLWARLC